MRRAARVALVTWVTAGSAAGLGACSDDVNLGEGESDAGAPDSGAEAATAPQTRVVAVGLAGAADAAVDRCGPIVSKILTGDLKPPLVYAGFQLALSADSNTGLTIDEANQDKCGVDEPATTLDGYRTVTFGGSDGVSLSYNVESRVIYRVVLGSRYRGSAQFYSAPGSKFGEHAYDVGFPYVHKDGIQMALPWSIYRDPDITWPDELFDALSDTFAPGTGAKGECLDESTCLVDYDGDKNETLLFGANDISFYVMVKSSTYEVQTMYGFWRQAAAQCHTTPNAVHEAMINAPIVPGVGDAWPQIGGVSPALPPPNGLTKDIADGLYCNGVDATPEDVGYSAMRWGDHGEIELEYNATTKIAYKLRARAGYRGLLRGLLTRTDGNIDSYALGVGTLTKNGAPFAIDWSDPGPSLAALEDALVASATKGAGGPGADGGADGGAVDAGSATSGQIISSGGVAPRPPDCLESGECAVVEDGRGHADVELVSLKLHVVFSTVTGVPESIYAIWPKGK